MAGIQLNPKDDLKLLIFLSPPPKCQDYRHVSPCTVFLECVLIIVILVSVEFVS